MHSCNPHPWKVDAEQFSSSVRLWLQQKFKASRDTWVSVSKTKGKHLHLNSLCLRMKCGRVPMCRKGAQPGWTKQARGATTFSWWQENSLHYQIHFKSWNAFTFISKFKDSVVSLPPKHCPLWLFYIPVLCLLQLRSYQCYIDINWIAYFSGFHYSFSNILFKFQDLSKILHYNYGYLDFFKQWNFLGALYLWRSWQQLLLSYFGEHLLYTLKNI